LLSILPEQRLPFSRIRLPPKPEGPREYKENDEVEVLSAPSDGEVQGWWRGVVKVMLF